MRQTAEPVVVRFAFLADQKPHPMLTASCRVADATKSVTICDEFE